MKMKTKFIYCFDGARARLLCAFAAQRERLTQHRTEAIQTRTPLRVTMRSSASRLVLTIRRWGLMRWTATQPALTTPWRVGAGGPQAASTPHALLTRRRCYKTAWSLLQGELTALIAFASAELYDPASGTWTATGSLNTARV